MNSPTKAPLTERQKTALLNLLADEDPAVYQTIRTTILACGPEAVTWLRPAQRSADPVLRRRSLEIAQTIEREVADHRFLVFCLHHGEDLDLENGAWLLAQTQYPETNILAYQAVLDSFADELQERLAGFLEPESVVARINDYLFHELGFAGNHQDYYDPDNSYLNRVVDRRLGNPISLCAVYLFLGRRLQLPLTGIGMPGRFVCRYQSSKGEFYVDVFNQGKLLTKGDCVRYLLQSGHGYLEGFLAPYSPRRTLLRMCHNVHQIYVDLELTREAMRFQRYIVALSR